MKEYLMILGCVPASKKQQKITGCYLRKNVVYHDAVCEECNSKVFISENQMKKKEECIVLCAKCAFKLRDDVNKINPNIWTQYNLKNVH